MDEFKTFMNLKDIDSVSEITTVFNKFGIPFKVQDTSKDFNVTFSNDESKNSYLLMINQTDFDKASSVLENKLPFDINQFDSNHPLFLFSVNELKDVVTNYDEWHPLDVKLAKYLLLKEDIIIDYSVINSQQNKKKLASEKQENSSILTLFIGYAFCIMGGLAGIGIAVFLLTGKRTMSDGSKQYIYSKSDRNHGVYMLLCGAICLTFFIFKYT